VDRFGGQNLDGLKHTCFRQVAADRGVAVNGAVHVPSYDQ